MFESYEFSTLAFPLLAVSDAAGGVRSWVTAPEARGTLLGCWRTEIGALGHLLVLRGFGNADERQKERNRALMSDNPFNAGKIVKSLDVDGYAPFPFLPAVQPGERGKVYEFRTYILRPGGLSQTLAGWEKALTRAHEYAKHLVINMYALEGTPRITHIWAFSSLEERSELRANAYNAKLWPPEGGPENILRATSTIALPEPWSPLS